MKIIIAKDINKSFGSLHVLRNINLEIESGKITVLFGPSGCGKTTLIRNLSLLDSPDKGELSIFGKEYVFPSKNRKIDFPYPRLTVIFQQLFLWPNLTNRANILLSIGREIRDHSDHLEYFEFLISKMEMRNYIDKYPNESSLGQKQRVAIARALILRPEFILCDEITASLDILQVNNVLRMLLALINDRVGLLFITHNIDVARKLGDKLIFMTEGEIRESGGKEILTSPKSEELIHFLNSAKL